MQPHPEPNSASRKISIAFGGVLGWGSGTAVGLRVPADRGSGLGQRGPQQAGNRGRGRRWQQWQPPLPHNAVPTLISHPASSGLRAQDAASRLILLVPIVNISVRAFGKETLHNNLPCVYSAFN